MPQGVLKTCYGLESGHEWERVRNRGSNQARERRRAANPDNGRDGGRAGGARGAGDGDGRAPPILFVHGNSGTGAQFQSQALRLTSNGYPASWIDEVDYNSRRGSANAAGRGPMIDAKIAELKKRTGAAQVDLIGHSQGTMVRTTT